MIPYSTDAPLYHRPIATVAIILITTLLYFVVPSRQLELHSPPAQPTAGVFDPFAPPDLPPGDPAPPDKAWDADAFSIVQAPVPADGPAPEAGAPKVGVDGGNEEGERGLQKGDIAADGPLPDARHAGGKALAPLTLALEHGVGLRPWQWISSLFLHAGFVQLLLNLLSLWAFGLVVEGKVGAWPLLAIYLGIGSSQAALEQTLTLWATPSVSMGANAALLGLLGVAVVWAPRNEFSVVWGFGVRGGSIEIPVLMFGFIQLAVELIGVASGGFGITASLMHLVGLAMGFAVGAVCLRRGWVDCEGWDLFNVWHGRETGVARDEQLEAEARALVRASVPDRAGKLGGPVAGPPRKGTRRSWSNRTAREVTPPPLPVGQQRLQVVERAIAEGNLAVALKLYAKLQVSQPEEQLSQAALFELIKLLLKAKDYQRAIPLLRQHIALFSEQRLGLQLNLAQLLLYLQQPRKSLEVLHAVLPGQLAATQRATWQELIQHAQAQIDEGTLEISE